MVLESRLMQVEGEVYNRKIEVLKAKFATQSKRLEYGDKVIASLHWQLTKTAMKSSNVEALENELQRARAEIALLGAHSRRMEGFFCHRLGHRSAGWFDKGGRQSCSSL